MVEIDLQKFEEYKNEPQLEVNRLGQVRVKGSEDLLHLNKGYNDNYRVNFRGKDYYVHRMVGEMFVPNPNNYKYIHHIDDNRSNNKASNLTWSNKRKTKPKEQRETISRPMVRLPLPDDKNYKVIPSLPMLECTSDGRIRKCGETLDKKCNYKRNGYYTCFYLNNRYYVHRLIAETWLENPNNYKYVRHIDGDKTNNNVNNLQWMN